VLANYYYSFQTPVAADGGHWWALRALALAPGAAVHAPLREALSLHLLRTGEQARRAGIVAEDLRPFSHFLGANLPWTQPLCSDEALAREEQDGRPAEALAAMTQPRSMQVDAPAPLGWHLSYFYEPAAIALKIATFVHPEMARDEFTDVEAVERRVRAGADVFDRGDAHPLGRVACLTAGDEARSLPRSARGIFPPSHFPPLCATPTVATVRGVAT
jgi:hypothetical protein